jgi:hypothetical protein
METDLLPRFEELIRNIQKLKSTFYPDFDLKVGYLTVFSNDNDDFDNLRKRLGELGAEAQANNGYKYLLNQNIQILSEDVKLIRVRKPDIHRKELGCCDLLYKESDYLKLRKMALDRGLDIILRKDYEMIELSTFDTNAYAYIVKDSVE